MRLIGVVLFFCAFVQGCGLQVERPAKILVTEVSMPEGEVFAPGDEVTVRAEGLEANDEIWFEIAWTEGSEEFAPEGWAKGVRGIVTERTAGTIVFLVPGHYPPATVTVLLFREGIFQTLGTIRVSDGVWHEISLYTLAPASAEGTEFTRYSMYGSAETCAGRQTIDQPLSYAVGSIGSGMACGVADDRFVEVDLITRYVREQGEGCLLAGATAASTVVALYGRDDRLYLSGGTSQPRSWQLPEGVTLGQIVRQPFVYASRSLLLTVRNDDGTFSPLVLPLSGGFGALLGEAVESEMLLPYWLLKPASDNPERIERVGGYAALHDGWTWFQPLDPSTLELASGLEHADLVVEGRVLSLTQCLVNGEDPAGEKSPEVRIGVLCATDTGREVSIYNPSSRSGTRVLNDVDLSAVTGIFFAQ